MRVQRCAWTVALALIVGSSTAAFAETNLMPVAEEGEQARDIDVGTRLVATNDVKLREVSLSKGARVTVRKIEASKGRITSLDVELADGHLLKHVAMDTIRRSFIVDAE